MSKLSSRITAVARETTDAIIALVEAAWPRSMTSREIERLTLDGYPAGRHCDVYFLLSFDTADWESALDDLHAEGFMVRDTSASVGAFVTVKTRIRLNAFALSLAGARLDRVAARHAGIATLIGPALAGRGPANDPATSAAGVEDTSATARYSGAA